MVEMTCEEHDRQAASTQFVTHTVGRMLGTMQLASTDINTRGYEALLQLVTNTTNDSFELYYGLFLYNTNATGECCGTPRRHQATPLCPCGAARLQRVATRKRAQGSGCLGRSPSERTGARDTRCPAQ